MRERHEHKYSFGTEEKEEENNTTNVVVVSRNDGGGGGLNSISGEEKRLETRLLLFLWLDVLFVVFHFMATMFLLMHWMRWGASPKWMVVVSNICCSCGAPRRSYETTTGISREC